MLTVEKEPLRLLAALFLLPPWLLARGTVVAADDLPSVEALVVVIGGALSAASVGRRDADLVAILDPLSFMQQLELKLAFHVLGSCAYFRLPLLTVVMERLRAVDVRPFV